MDKTFYEQFLKRKPSDILQVLGNLTRQRNIKVHPAKLYHSLDVTYSYLVGRLNLLEREKIIRIKRRPKKRYIDLVLTIKGEEICDHLNAIHNKFRQLASR